MINEAAVFIRDEVASYLMQVKAVINAQDVLLGNIAMLENQHLLSDSVVITLVNLEEESVLKNSKNWSRNHLTGGIETTMPPVYLNLYFLFTATLPETLGSDDQAYQRSLARIASIIEFFQSKKLFTLQNSPNFERQDNLEERFLNEIRLVPELYTLTFEQINHLWGSLGGKQSPFVMYKIRLIKIQGQITEEAPHIESIDVEDDLWVRNSS